MSRRMGVTDVVASALVVLVFLDTLLTGILLVRVNRAERVVTVLGRTVRDVADDLDTEAAMESLGVSDE